MSALLRGPNTEPRASTKLDETLEAKGGQEWRYAQRDPKTAALRRMAPEQLLGRTAEALTNFFENIGIVLRHCHN